MTTGAEFEPRWLDGLRVLVTGAAGLFGRTLVEEASRQRAFVAASGREPSISQAKFPDAVHVLRADLADPDESSSLIQRTVEELGGLDILINNAAHLLRRDFEDLERSDFERAWAVNLRAPVLLMQEAVTHLMRSAAPVIVNVTSTAAFNGGIGNVMPYAMTKAGLVAATKSAAKELGGRGIRVLCVSPPTMPSQMQRDLRDSEQARVQGLNLLGRPADVREAAVVTLFLASPYASFVTGTTVDITATAL